MTTEQFLDAMHTDSTDRKLEILTEADALYTAIKYMKERAEALMDEYVQLRGHRAHIEKVSFEKQLERPDMWENTLKE